jgi:hypothetical protein
MCDGFSNERKIDGHRSQQPAGALRSAKRRARRLTRAEGSELERPRRANVTCRSMCRLVRNCEPGWPNNWDPIYVATAARMITSVWGWCSPPTRRRFRPSGLRWFPTVPLWGLAFAWLALGEPVQLTQLAAAGLMGVAIWLWHRERHSHVHAHPRVTHSHWHRHDDGHHDHEHVDGVMPATGWQNHEHTHEPMEHVHAHAGRALARRRGPIAALAFRLHRHERQAVAEQQQREQSGTSWRPHSLRLSNPSGMRRPHHESNHASPEREQRFLHFLEVE